MSYELEHNYREYDIRDAHKFNLPGHSLVRTFKIIPNEQPPIHGSKTDTDLLRLEPESLFWIRTLETKIQFRINM